MSQSLKQIVEEWAKYAMENATVPVTTPIHTVDDSTQAELVRIIVTAEIEEQQLEGPECFETGIKVELRSNNPDAASADAIFETVEAAFYGLSAAAITQAQSLFEVLIFYPEKMESEDARAQNTRRRERTFPFDIVPLSGIFVPSGDLFFEPSGDLMFA